MSTRPRVSWSELGTARVGLWGLGVEGAANLRRLRAMGNVPVLVDDDPVPGDLDGLEILATGLGGREALEGCEVVVKTPGVSRYRPEVARLTERGIPVVGGLGLWMQEVDLNRVVCITGTKGKSTTAALTGHLLAGLGRRCLVAGNIGRPPYDPEVGGDVDYWVVETSSFQATDLASSPPVVAVTSLSPDHLDWHGDAETYYHDKLSACTQPGALLTIADGDNELLGSRRGLLGPEVRWVGAHAPGLDGSWVDHLGLLGTHNRRNALIARAILEALGIEEAADEAALAGAAEGFEALDSRLRAIGTVGGVTFVDDSLSTNVLPTLAALEAFADRRVSLLVGGFDRGIDYAPLAEALVARDAATLVLTLPASGRRIHQAINAALAALPGSHLEVADCDDLGAATEKGYRWARPDGVVLLSPAAPSFGQFTNYTHRSAAFAEAMASCP